jgi:hypothetical protein
MDDDERLKKSLIRIKRALSDNFYLAPDTGYDVFVRAHVGHQTCIICFARFRADSKSPHSARLAYRMTSAYLGVCGIPSEGPVLNRKRLEHHRQLRIGLSVSSDFSKILF